MNMFIKWSENDLALSMLIPLASRCMFTFYAAAVDPKWNYVSAAALFGFQVNLHLLCSSSSTSIYTIKQQQQVQSYIHFSSSNNLAVVVKVYFFYLYISPYIITHFLHLINRFFCLTEKISGYFLLITWSWTWTFTYARLQQQFHRIHSFRQQQ